MKPSFTSKKFVALLSVFLLIVAVQFFVVPPKAEALCVNPMLQASDTLSPNPVPFGQNTLTAGMSGTVCSPYVFSAVQLVGATIVGAGIQGTGGCVVPADLAADNALIASSPGSWPYGALPVCGVGPGQPAPLTGLSVLPPGVYSVNLVGVNIGGLVNLDSTADTFTILSPVTVAIAPKSASVQVGNTQQFTATVTGGSGNTNVTWTVAGGAANGTVSATGLYTAPASVPAGVVTVTAASQEDPSKSDSATVTVTAAPPPVSIIIVPKTASVQTGNTQQFKGTVSGTANKGVTWKVVGGAANGTINSAGLYTAPASVPAGVVTVTVTSQADNTKSDSATVTITAAPPPGTGTINVSSINSVTGQPVAATWDVSGATDLGDHASYANVPLGPPSYTFTALSASDPSGPYSLGNVCRAYNRAVNVGTDCLPVPGASVSLSLVNNGDSDNFLGLWNPESKIQVSAVAVGLTDGSPTSPVSISNAGAPGSTLSWSSIITYTNGSGWLSVSPTSGGGLTPGGAAATVTITANPTGLSNGTYVATVTFSGTSAPSGKVPAPVTVQVTLVVSGAGGGPGGSPITTISPNPVAVCEGASLNCSGGSGIGYVWTSSDPAVTTFTPSNSGSSVSVAFTKPGTYQETCTDSAGATSSVAITATIPNCSLTASPAQVTVPEPSTLSWICDPSAISCTLDDGTGPKSVAPVGSEQVSPTKATTYTLVCKGAGGTCSAPGGSGSDTSVATSSVVVTQPIIHE